MAVVFVIECWLTLIFQQVLFVALDLVKSELMVCVIYWWSISLECLSVKLLTFS